MKAILLKEYGLPNFLEIGEVSKPIPKDKEVLVRIHSASINDWDWGLVRGRPFVIRLVHGLKKPKINIPGADISGKIEAIGSKVNSFKIGDEIYCDLSECGFGGFAEYVCVPEKTISKKPSNISYNDAAALPHAGLLALQGLMQKGKVKSGQHILINGAGGGVGSLGIQILKLHGIKATGVDSGEKLNLLKSMGFDNVMDYKKIDFTNSSEKYDLILDTKSNRSVFKYARSLKRNGTYITVGGLMYRLFEVLLLGKLISLFTSKKLSVLNLKTNKGLDQISNLVENGQIKPIIDGPYEFDEIPMLIQYFGEGRHQGKIVVEIKK
ncbi:NAD(P)-dependent alcohol dehydrogenase [Galbibacter pacificus]|uniref:NAD(P)-dependent alcohol dehydrogenase n=1 Tax=Galbibacter pacificus TaxID=2996052 RepID=A0ABT6FPC1_9FLAO|nr:NAD(P)-dependent alcohol dehydrogenase [Galbibacter pacificus]MDG3581638.1 NAD(P)-dependent alcohol dehydrogenase [Galbibacter pacificus]MDG3585116.1 NAD(P)-dependent alcohol dehydrogenase [Galbibacter pacificus]